MSFHLKQTSPETYGNHACNHQINCERLQSLVKLGHAPVDVTKSFNIFAVHAQPPKTAMEHT